MKDFPWLKLPVMLALWLGMFALKLLVGLAGLFVMPFMWQYSATDYKDLPTWTRLWSNIEDWQGQPRHWGNSIPKWWIEQKVKRDYEYWYDRALNLIRSVFEFGYYLRDKVTGKAWPRPGWMAPAPYWLIQRGAKFFSFYTYHAIRNSANGLRSIDPFRLSIDEDLVGYVSNLRGHSTGDGPLAEKRGVFEPWYLRRTTSLDKKTVAYFAWQGWKGGIKIVHLWNDKRHLVIKLGWRVNPQRVNPIRFDLYTDAWREQRLLNDNVSFAFKILIWRKG